MTKLTQSELQEVLDYNPETGLFTWKVRRMGVRCGQVAGSRLNGYIRIKISGENYYAHRLVWLYMNGVWPVDQIDHINRIKDDNRICNLREATRSENQWNVTTRSDNTSGHKNICRRTIGKYEYWLIQINNYSKKHEKLFPYTDEGLEQAILYRDNYIESTRQEFAVV